MKHTKCERNNAWLAAQYAMSASWADLAWGHQAAGYSLAWKLAAVQYMCQGL